MIRRKTVKLFELLVITAVVLGLRQLAGADALGTIEGTITAQAGTSIAGASVTIRGSGATCGHRTVSTDGSGHFAATGLPACRYTITATAPGFMAAGAVVHLASGATGAVALSLVQVAKAPEHRPPPPPRDLKPRPPAKESVRTLDVDKNMVAPAEAPMPSSPAPLAQPRMGYRGRMPMVLEQDPSLNTEGYSRIDENPFLATQVHPLSTFSVDVDTASYANTRRFLKQGQLPPKDAVRIEELINYFHYDLPRRAAGPAVLDHHRGRREPVEHALSGSCASASGAADRRRQGPGAQPGVPDRRVGLDARPEQAAAAQARTRVAGRAAPRPQDRVAIVVYAGNSGLVLPSTSGREKSAIRNALAALEAGGSTNGAAGIQLAYQTAQQNFIKGGINRVILCTDGDFNVGTTSEGDLTRLIEDKREKRRVPHRARLRHGQPQGLDDGEARRQGQRQLRVHRLDRGGAQGARQGGRRDARHRRQGRQAPGRVQPGAGRGLPPDRLREPAAPRRGLQRRQEGRRRDRRGSRGDRALRDRAGRPAGARRQGRRAQVPDAARRAPGAPRTPAS